MSLIDVVRDYLSYDPDTGVFTWIKDPCQSVSAGDTAGTIDRRGFVEIGLKGKIYKAHRLAHLLMEGFMPKGRMRHRNHNRSDNRYDNLRVVGSPLDHRTLLEEIHYDPLTGHFTYVETGKPAGSEKEGYISVALDGRYYRGHRLAWFYMKGEWPENQIDHENTIKSDNRFVNLRPATCAQNRRNVGKTVANTSGWKGVGWHKGRSAWVARIGFEGKRITLGYYGDVKEAAEAYIFAALEHHGEYARFD